MSINIRNWVKIDIGHRTLENPSTECPKIFITGDGCPVGMNVLGPYFFHLASTSISFQDYMFGLIQQH